MKRFLLPAVALAFVLTAGAAALAQEGGSPDAGGPPTGEDVIQIGGDVFIDCGQVFGAEPSAEPDPDPEQTEALQRLCIEAGILHPGSEGSSTSGVSQYQNARS
jgi:hypothetical protein